MNEPPDSPAEPVHVWLTTTGENPRAAAHALLRDLAASLGVTAPLHHSSTGQPLIDGLHVSLTHTTGVAAVAAGHTTPVGLDAELRRTFPVTAMAHRWFTPTEAARVAESPETFLLLWTAKEAVGKALGRGLRANGLRRPMPPGLTADEVSEPPTHQLIAHVVPSEPQLVVLQVGVRREVVLALACSVGVTEVVVHHGTALRSTVRSRTSFPVVVRGN